MIQRNRNLRSTPPKIANDIALGPNEKNENDWSILILTDHKKNAQTFKLTPKQVDGIYKGLDKYFKEKT
jgi:hypothetical protein